MKIEVILSTMHQESIDIYKKLNIESDFLIINQTDKEEYFEKNCGQFLGRMISTTTRGLGRSRNLGVLNSNADIIVIADDDEVFEQGYRQIIKDEFEKHPDVSMFVFKTIIYQDGKEIIKVKEDKDLSLFNSLKYGSVHFAFKREDIQKHNISFSTYFGAGTENGSGEDSIFISDVIKSGLKVRSSTKLLAKVYNDNSTWFTGHDEKFFYDKGKLSKALFPRLYRLYIEQYLIRHKEILDKLSLKQARKMMIQGATDFGGRK